LLLTCLFLRFFILSEGGTGSVSLYFLLGFSGGRELGRPDLAGVTGGAISRRAGGAGSVAEEGEMGPCQIWAVGEEGVMEMSVDKSLMSAPYFSLAMRWGMTSS
jgi:hypothetical protein